MVNQIFSELSELFLQNVEVIRKAIKMYKEDKNRLVEVLLDELDKHKYEYDRKYDTEIGYDQQYFNIAHKSNKKIRWRIMLSAGQIVKKSVLILKQESYGKWEEIKEVVLASKSPAEIVEEIIHTIQK